jgi:hypothetical protein
LGALAIGQCVVAARRALDGSSLPFGQVEMIADKLEGTGSGVSLAQQKREIANRILQIAHSIGMEQPMILRMRPAMSS